MPVEIDEITTQVREVPAGQSAVPLTPEMVRIIADKVIALFLNDLRIEAERRRFHSSQTSRPQKGRK